LQDSLYIRHQESQGSWPDPLDEVGILDKIGTRALPASSLSAASACAFVITFLFLQLGKVHSLFMLSRATGLGLGITSAALAWTIVVQCSRRPGCFWPRSWALLLAVLTIAFVPLLFAFPTETWISALIMAGVAAVLVLLFRLIKLRPDNGLVSRIAPLTLVVVLPLVLLAAGWMRHAMVASKTLRVDQMIDQLSRWDADVNRVTSRDWSAADWDNASRAVDQLNQIQLDGHLDLSLWREASALGKDGDLATAAGKLLDTTVAGLTKDRVPRVSRLSVPAAYYDVQSKPKRWKKSAVFPKASETVGQYFQEMGRIFSELDVQDSFPESGGLTELKKRYLEKRARLTEELRSQMGSWTDHWAVLRVPECDHLVGQCDMPLGRFLRTPSPIRREPAADLQGLLSISYETARNLGKLSGCRRLLPYQEPKEGTLHEFYRIDCYSYSPRPKDLGADLRVEMRLVYDSPVAVGFKSSDMPEEVYFLFPLPEGMDEDEFKKQIMSDFAETISEATGLETDAGNRGNSQVNGFKLRGVAVRPRFVPWLEGRKGLEVRAQREK